MSSLALKPLLARSRRLLPTGLDSRAAGPVIFLVVGVAYLALAQFVLWLNDPANVGASLWFASGLSLGALLLLLPPRLWGWVLSAVAVAEVGGRPRTWLPAGCQSGLGAQQRRRASPRGHPPAPLR